MGAGSSWISGPVRAAGWFACLDEAGRLAHPTARRPPGHSRGSGTAAAGASAPGPWPRPAAPAGPRRPGRPLLVHRLDGEQRDLVAVPQLQRRPGRLPVEHDGAHRRPGQLVLQDDVAEADAVGVGVDARPPQEEQARAQDQAEAGDGDLVDRAEGDHARGRRLQREGHEEHHADDDRGGQRAAPGASAAGRRGPGRGPARTTRSRPHGATTGRLAECEGVEITGTAQHEAWQARALPPVEQLRDGPVVDPGADPAQPAALRQRLRLRPRRRRPGGARHRLGERRGLDGADRRAGLDRRRGRRRPRRAGHPPALRPPRPGRPRAGGVRRVGGHAPGRRRRRSPASPRPGPRRWSPPRSSSSSAWAPTAPRPSATSGPPERMAAFTRMAVPDRLLEDGEHADFPGWRMRAVHTPGHTPGPPLLRRGEHRAVLLRRPRPPPDQPEHLHHPRRARRPAARLPRLARRRRAGWTRPRCCRPTSGASAGSTTASTPSPPTTSSG